MSLQVYTCFQCYIPHFFLANNAIYLTSWLFLGKKGGDKADESAEAEPMETTDGAKAEE